ncbi:Fc.00g096280.m01.CDS01 [Cosmosporella sp. VM-42]
MTTVRVWVDALCINQTDILERNVQVEIMGNIYAAARKVYVCLGEQDTHGDTSIEDDMDGLEKVLNLLETRDFSNWPLELKHRKFVQIWFHVLLIHQKSWFRRAWVLQEVGLAGNPRVLYGKWEFGYKLLMQITVWSSQSDGGDFRLACGSRIHFRWLDWLKEPLSNASFFDLLYDARTMRCKDPRDHIYAFLGHPLLQRGDLDNSLLSPDYSKDVATLFRQFSTALAQNNDTRLLGCIQHTESTLAEDIPSWVIRWDWWETGRSNGQFSLPGVRNSDSEQRTWKASEGIIGPPLTLSDNLLQAHGTTIDTMEEVYRILLKPEEGDIQFQRHDKKYMISPFDLLDRLGELPLIYGNKITPETSPVPITENFSTPVNILTVTLGGGFLSEDVLQGHLERKPLQNMQGGPHGQSGDPDAGMGNLKRLGSYEKRPRTLGVQFLGDIRKACQHRSFAVTKLGHYLLVPSVTKPGDMCCILAGFSGYQEPWINYSSKQPTTIYASQRQLARRTAVMRLINVKTYTITQFFDEIPPYAILSHTWGEEEVTLQDMRGVYLSPEKSLTHPTKPKADNDAQHQSLNPRVTNMQGFKKIKYACEETAKGTLRFVWVDTCCIDKSSSAELSEAINSMFQWYENARKCYAYLQDVSSKDHASPEFMKSKWFTPFHAYPLALKRLVEVLDIDYYDSENAGICMSLERGSQSVPGTN